MRVLQGSRGFRFHQSFRFLSFDAFRAFGVFGVCGVGLAFQMASWIAATSGMAMGREVPTIIIESPSKIPHLILSKVSFDGNGNSKIAYPDISVADPLTSCPLDPLPVDIGAAVSKLLETVRDSVSKIKAARGDQCSILQDRMKMNSAQLGIALQNQFIAAREIPSSANQDKINAQTQQASALSGLLMTASDMFRQECISTLDNKIVIQKLLGQIIMLSGLYRGGWEGLSVAAAGQLLGNLPLFRDELDKALQLFQSYDERNLRGSFLCLYRQMQKMSVLLFAGHDARTIHGLDLSFQTGPVRTTIESIGRIQNETPLLLEDVAMLRDLARSAHLLISQMEEENEMKKGSFTLFHSLREWCMDHQVEELRDWQRHLVKQRESLAQALRSIKTTCDDLKVLKWTVKTPEEVSGLLVISYWNLITIREYYSELRRNGASEVARAANTWESFKYFEDLKNSVRHYWSSEGNQARQNYRILTESLGNDLALNSFSSLMWQNYKTLTRQTFFNPRPIHGHSVRSRALQAMLDLCQVLDPTLVQLYVDNPDGNKLLAKWKTLCVGPSSLVCKDILGTSAENQLLRDPRYRVYFYSLCGNVFVHRDQPD